MSLAVPCLLTVLIETAFLALCGYRSRLFIALCVCVNAATNLSLNLLLSVVPYRAVSVYVLELAVLGIEYGAYALALGRGKRLFLLTLAANALTFATGVLIYGPVS